MYNNYSLLEAQVRHSICRRINRMIELDRESISYRKELLLEFGDDPLREDALKASIDELEACIQIAEKVMGEILEKGESKNNVR